MLEIRSAADPAARAGGGSTDGEPLTELRRQAGRAESRANDLGVQLAQLRAEHQSVLRTLAQQLDELRAAPQLSEENTQLRQLAADLQREVDYWRQAARAHEQHVDDLLKSRWRKLGLKLGIARRAAWEAQDA